MQFYGRIKRNSSIYTDWRQHNRLAGFIDGVFFKLKGFDFVTDKLETEQIEKFRSRQDQAVELEMISLIPIVLGPDLELEAGSVYAHQETEPLISVKRPRLRKTE